MNFNKNRQILDRAVQSMNEWSNADGDFDMDDAFDMDSAFDNDNGYEEAAGTPAARPQISLPYIFTVTNSNAVASETVVLFGSEKNRTAANFGNSLNISISYDFSGYYGGGVTGYSALLGRTESAPLVIGRIRVECTNATQLSAALNVSDFDPTGKQVTYPVVNFRKLNQFDQNAVETETDMTIYGGTELSYTQLSGGVTPLVCRWFFYPADVASLKRGLVGKGVVKELRRPETYLQETVKLQAPAGKKLAFK